MTFAGMNNKSRDIPRACGTSTLDNLPDNKFFKKYYKKTKPNPYDDLSDEFSRIPNIEDLKSFAEEAFANYYGVYPTCAAYAPGCLNLAGKGVNHVESKSLPMAVQLVTLIVGKRSRGSKWCHVKTLSDEIPGDKVFGFYLNAENLDVTKEKKSWVRYLKATIQSFKARGAYVPGFKIVITSSVPVKRGLGSSSALVVALYTFLEAITNTYTGNILEKTLACHLAEKLAVGSFRLRLADTLASVIGEENKIFSFDARSLDVDRCDWDPLDAELVFIVNDTVEIRTPSTTRSNAICKEIRIISNATSRWRAHPLGTSIMKSLFSRETINTAESIDQEDERVSRLAETIRSERWDELGKLLWENYRSTREFSSPLPDDTKYIMTVLETTEGVLGANAISHDNGAAVIVLVQRSRLKTFIYLLSRMKVSQQRYFIVRSLTGATILYKYEHSFYPWDCTKRTKLIIKYHLHDEDNSEPDDYDKFEPAKSLSLFIPQEPFFD